MSKVTFDSLNPKLLEAQYAVRGSILIEANKINEELKQGEKHPFDSITYCNIGNPQRLGQAPITFARNVLSLVTSPELRNSEYASKIFEKDEIERANFIVDNTPGVVGGYTHSQGLDFIRKDVSSFIAERDELPGPPIDRIYMTDGASVGIQNVMFSLIRNEKDGIMIPIPQYPLYSASISLFGGSLLGYYLTEEKKWAIEKEDLDASLKEAKEKGVNVRALVVINPGNPTGQVLSLEDMKSIIKFCKENGIVLLADEVYQENIYDESIQWYSFNKVLTMMGKEYEDMELVSFHSVSKGFFGECGRRGGYMVFSKGFDTRVMEQMYKKASINLCPNIDGQIVASIMVNPPKKGTASYEKYAKEKQAILDSLKRRSQKLTKMLDSLENMSCNPSKGAMYAFPNVVIPKKAIEEAEKNGMKPDLFYCMQLLRATGIVTVPGNGFKQKDGTFHLRTTFLPKEDVMDEVIEKFRKFHVDFMQKYK